MTRFGFSQAILDQIVGVIRRYPAVKSAMIFGSRAKNLFHSGSDIDIAIFSDTLSEQEFLSLCHELEDLPIIFSIDCVHVEKLTRPTLIQKIQQEGVQIV